MKVRGRPASPKGKSWKEALLEAVEACNDEGIAIARNYGYIGSVMIISVADAKNRLSQLIRAVEDGEEVIITRSGKPVAQLTPAPKAGRKVRLGTMRNRIVLKPGWDAPVTEDQFLNGAF